MQSSLAGCAGRGLPERRLVTQQQEHQQQSASCAQQPSSCVHTTHLPVLEVLDVLASPPQPGFHRVKLCSQATQLLLLQGFVLLGYLCVCGPLIQAVA